MAVVQLASAEDVEAVLGRDLTTEEAVRVEPVLDKASELFRRASGQDFTAGTSTVRLKVNGGQVYLTQRPVVSVESVTDDDGTELGFDLFGQWLTVDRVSHQFVRVSYSHGGEVPDLVRLTVAEVAKKVLSIDPNAVSGVIQHQDTAGPFSRNDTYASWAQGGQTMLAPADLEIAQSFRVRVPAVWVMRP